MSPSLEAQVLQWFDLALEQPASERGAWLVAQVLPEAVSERVLRLIDAEATLGDFLAEVVEVPNSGDFPRVGERLGSYELVRQLDAGGMGVVFLARRADEIYEQQVAIKLIRPLHLSAAPAFRRELVARFETERVLLARLSHPNVARILDGGSTAAGIPYLVMEFVDGVALNKYCDAQALDVGERLRLFRKVCDGVQEAHRHLIVHRDLKPENILVGADGEPRLLDFGIARTLDQAGGFASGAATALTAMTPAYASPEQVRHEPLTTSSDVYSLGVVLYQLLSGTRPYSLEGLSPAQAERRVCEAEPASLRKAVQQAEMSDDARRRRHAQLDTDLDRIVCKAMHKDGSRRYASAQEFAADLQRYLDGQPVLAHPDSRTYRAAKFIGRHRLGSAAAALAIAAIVAAAGVAVWQAHAARRSADDMRQVNAFLLDVLKLSDPFASGSELTLSQALDSAAQTIDKRFSGRPDLSADIRFGIGYSMLSRNRIEAAEKQLSIALAESESAFGKNDIRTLRILEGVAGVRQEQGRMGDAEATFKEAIARIEASGQQRDPLYFLVLGNLGNLALVREDYRTADDFLRQAIALPDAPKAPSPDHAAALSNLAQAAHGLLDYQRADRLYRESQAEFAQLFPEGNPDQAILLNNRAVLADDRGDKRESLALHRQSLAMRRKVFGGEHPMIAVALYNVARKAAELGDKSIALDSAREATQMADRVFTEPNSRHASAHITLAQAQILNGDLAAAANALKRAREILAAVPEPTPSVVEYLEKTYARLCAVSALPASAVTECTAEAGTSVATKK
ncbi:MAG: serine/threonine-protein kinase [Dokdonella sp.]